MLSATILCPADLRSDESLSALADIYIKRIDARIDIRHVPCKTKPSDPPTLVIRQQEAALKAALDKLKAPCIVALDERGKTLSSPDFAGWIENRATQGQSHICFIIGGAYGLGADILTSADLRLSFGPMVWPHRLVSVMLLEQIYRARTIAKGHPYHKA